MSLAATAGRRRRRQRLIRPYCRAPRRRRLDDRWTGSFDDSVRECIIDEKPEGSKGVEPCACSACRLHPLVPEDTELLGYIRHQLHEHSADAIEDDGRRKVLTREADVKRIPALGRSADDFRRVLGALEARDRLGSDRPLVREEDWQLMCTIHKNAREHGLSAPPLALMTEEDRCLFNERRTSDRDLQRYEKLGTMDGIRRFVDDTLALADVEVPMPVGDATKAKCVRAWRQGRSEAECSRHVCALCETCVRPRDMERTASGLKGYTVRGVDALLMQGHHSNACATTVLGALKQALRSAPIVSGTGEDLNALKVDELKDRCRAAKLKVGGKKEDLIERLGGGGGGGGVVVGLDAFVAILEGGCAHGHGQQDLVRVAIQELVRSGHVAIAEVDGEEVISVNASFDQTPPSCGCVDTRPSPALRLLKVEPDDPSLRLRMSFAGRALQPAALFEDQKPTCETADDALKDLEFGVCRSCAGALGRGKLTAAAMAVGNDYGHHLLKDHRPEVYGTQHALRCRCHRCHPRAVPDKIARLGSGDPHRVAWEASDPCLRRPETLLPTMTLVEERSMAMFYNRIIIYRLKPVEAGGYYALTGHVISHAQQDGTELHCVQSIPRRPEELKSRVQIVFAGDHTSFQRLADSLKVKQRIGDEPIARRAVLASWAVFRKVCCRAAVRIGNKISDPLYALSILSTMWPVRLLTLPCHRSQYHDPAYEFISVNSDALEEYPEQVGGGGERFMVRCEHVVRGSAGSTSSSSPLTRHLLGHPGSSRRGCRAGHAAGSHIKRQAGSGALHARSRVAGKGRRCGEVAVHSREISAPGAEGLDHPRNCVCAVGGSVRRCALDIRQWPAYAHFPGSKPDGHGPACG